MARGGYRKGAGRKKGVSNLLTSELRKKIKAKEIIAFLQDLALGKIEGASLSERKEAAVALLKKVMPDIGHVKTEIDTTEFKPLNISGKWD